MLILAVFFDSVALLILDVFTIAVLTIMLLSCLRGICKPMKLETVFLLRLIEVWFVLCWFSFFLGLLLCLNLWMFYLITDKLL